MIRACIFDLDGTLLNTLETIAHYANQTLNKFDLPAIPTERYRYLVGNGARILVERMLQETQGDMALFGAAFEDYTQSYDKEPLYLTAPYDGILDLLRELKSRNIKIAVLSNKPHNATAAVVKAIFGTDTFDRCYGQREGVPIKPDPTALIALMDELGVSPEECLYVGDTATDMQTGRGAGAKTVGVLWGFRDRDELAENGAELLVEHPRQLLDALV